jgi:integrase
MVQIGRRGNEIVSLRWKHITISGRGKQQKITLHFDHCKGAKKMRDTLDEDTAAVFLEYLYAIYGRNLMSLEKDAPVWVSCSRQNQGKAISTHTLNDICETYLGTSKIHVTRHTFAYSNELEGAPLSEIQHRLDHERIETTATM